MSSSKVHIFCIKRKYYWSTICSSGVLLPPSSSSIIILLWPEVTMTLPFQIRVCAAREQRKACTCRNSLSKPASICPSLFQYFPSNAKFYFNIKYMFIAPLQLFHSYSSDEVVERSIAWSCSTQVQICALNTYQLGDLGQVANLSDFSFLI